MIEITTTSVEETEDLGKRLGSALRGKEVIAMFGGMGMGKTALTRGIAAALDVCDTVCSPTFALVNEYNGKFNIYHFDMYRIGSWDELYSTGFFDYLGNGILIVEWSENIENALPDDCIRIDISKGFDENSRILKIEGVDIA